MYPKRSVYYSFLHNPFSAQDAETQFVRRFTIIRRIVNRQFRIMATIEERDFVTKKDIYIFKLISDKFKPEYILGIINSKLISYLKTGSSVAARKDDFTQLTLTDIREIPIPEVAEDQQNKLTEKVKSLLLQNNSTSPPASTAPLEAEIDLLVYKLYGLSWEEVKIVDPDFEMSESAYAEACA